MDGPSRESAPASVCAVVVTYFPESSCATNLRALAPQVDELVVVDNGSSAESLQAIECATGELGATLLRLGSNFGIAKALNVGLTYARERGHRWLATFDQDSQATPGMIARMFAALNDYPEAGQVAIVAPCPVDRNLGVAIGYPTAECEDADWRVLPCVGTSGNLVSIPVACAVGGFDDSLFIDYVDFEFCMRLRRRGYRILEARRAVLIHSLGDLQYRRFIFSRVPVTHHPALRRYYMTRNRLVLWRLYWNRETAWVTRDIRRFLAETLYIVLFEKQVAAKIRMLTRGLGDGLKNVRGAYVPRQ
jgi:rhamnosyltransferase